MKSFICPICDKRMDNQGPKEWPAWPFCSERCRLVDLGNWLDGKYAIASTNDERKPDGEEEDEG